MHSGYLEDAPSDRPDKRVSLSTIVLLCVIAIVALRAYAAEAAPAIPAESGPTIEATVSGILRPGSTTAVAMTIANRSSQARHIGRIVLARIEADRGHPSCRASVTGEGTNFAMPPVEVERTLPPGHSRLKATGHLTMLETGVGQNACRGATLTLFLRAD